MRAVGLGGILALVLGGPANAAAQAAEGGEPGEEIEEGPADRDADRDGVLDFSHRGQVGLHLAGGMGYRGIFPYDGEYCGELKDGGGNKANCLGKSPFGFDVGLAYGLTDRLEGLLELRLGVERDIGSRPNVDGPRPVSILPGVKFYLADIGPTMFFSTLQLAIDFTSYDQIDKNDVGVRNVNGLQVDLHRTFGIFFFFGEQVSWRRWLRFEVEAGVGAQVRFP
jgi:hypothetical protein